MKRIASIDVGSNGIRLAIGEIQPNSTLRLIHSFRESVRLGRDVFRDGYIREQTARKALKAFLKFKKILKKFKVQQYRSVATSAVRDAKNSKHFIEYIFDKTGILLNLISGEAEANLIHTAIFSKINLVNRVAVLLDIGGGSIEITISRFGKITGVRSFKMGTVRLLNETDVQFGGNKITQIQKILREFEPLLKKFFKTQLREVKDFSFIGTGGNIESLLFLKGFLLDNSPTQTVKLSELEQILKILGKLTFEERIVKLGLRPDRADVIIPALLILKLVMTKSKAKEIIVPGVGLKDGVLIEIARSLPHEFPAKKIKLKKKSKKKHARKAIRR